MQIERNRMGRTWTFLLQGMDFNTALEIADREIEELREKIKIEAFEEFDRRSGRRKRKTKECMR